MPTNHIGKEVESTEVDCLEDRHFGCGSCTSLVLVTQMYFSVTSGKKYLTCASFKRIYWFKLKQDWISEDPIILQA